MSGRVVHLQKVAGIAGSENHLIMLLGGLRAAGWDPYFVALVERPGGADEFLERLQSVGVSGETVPIAGDLDARVVPRLARRIRRLRPDLVHTHLVHADIYGRLAGRLAGPRVVSSYHCDDPYHLIPWVRAADNLTARLCSRIICISDAVRDFVEHEIGVAPDRLQVVRYGMPPPRLEEGPDLRGELGLEEGTPLIGIVGRLHEQKGHLYLLRAMDRVRQDLPDAHLAVIGSGELKLELEAEVERLQLQDQVHFMGYRPDAARLIRSVDVVVLSSIYEGFGLVLLEAMAAARPLVATRVSAVPEIVVDGETGLLVESMDPASMARALLTLLRDPERRAAMGAAGRRRLISEFTVERMLDETIQVYRSVLDD